MKKNEMELFSEEQIENVSNLLDKNYYMLKKNKTYSQQQLEINKLHEEICNDSSKKLEDLFLKYESLMLDNRRYELLILYNSGIKRGFEMKDLISL